MEKIWDSDVAPMAGRTLNKDGLTEGVEMVYDLLFVPVTTKWRLGGVERVWDCGGTPTTERGGGEGWKRPRTHWSYT